MSELIELTKLFDEMNKCNESEKCMRDVIQSNHHFVMKALINKAIVLEMNRIGNKLYRVHFKLNDISTELMNKKDQKQCYNMLNKLYKYMDEKTIIMQVTKCGDIKYEWSLRK